MSIKKIIFSLIFIFTSLLLVAQTNTKPSNYNEAIQQGDNAFKRAEYTTAIEKYRIAETFDNTKWEVVQEKIEKVYKEINAALKATANIPLKEEKAVVVKNGNDSLNRSTSAPSHKKPKTLIWNDFLRLYDKRSDQWFVNIGYGFNIINDVKNSVREEKDTIIGHSIGFNAGYRHAVIKNFGIG